MADAATLAAEPVAPPPPEAIHPDQPVSVDMGDVVLTGVGETEETLREGLTPPKAEPQKPSRGRKRFDQLTYEAEEERRQRLAAETRIAELEAKLKAPEQAHTAPQPPAPAPTPAAQPSPSATQQVAANPTRTKPSEDQVGTTYQTYADFVEDLADWKAEQRLAAIDLDARIRSSIEADRASRTFVEQFSASIADARKVHADFDAVLESVKDITFPPQTVELIATTPNTGLLQYRLAKNRALAEKVAKMTNLGHVGYELAQLMADSAVASSASTAGSVVHVPPPPMQPVGSGSKTTVLSASDLADRGGEDYDASGFREQRRKELGRR